MKLFGTSGIRGFTNTEITPELSLRLGEALGSFFGKGKEAYLGRDTRMGSNMVEMAVASGLMSQGVCVKDAGCIPTPVLANYIITKEADCGVMVTGSHLPPDMVGIIPMMGDGAYMPDRYAEEVEDIFWQKRYEKTRVVDGIGSFDRVDDALACYRRVLLSLVDRNSISRAEFRVAVDPANGAASGFLADILRELHCAVTEVNGEPSGIPGRDPEPRASSLKELSAIMKDGHYDLGVGLDMDGDRIVFLDEKGRAISEDVAGIIFADRIFKDRGVFVTPVNSSGIVEWFSERRGVTLVYCKIGQPATVEAMKKVGAIYSYEESGKYYFPEVNWCCGLLATLKMLEICALKPISEIAAAYPNFHQVKRTIHLDAGKKEEIMFLIGQNLNDVLGEGYGRLVDIDGYKLIFPDHSWLLVRASGTEPLLRVYSDSPSRKRAEGLVERGLQFIRGWIE